MAVNYGTPLIVQDGLVLHLDAANIKSYPGSGTNWNDLSGNGFNFELDSSGICLLYTSPSPRDRQKSRMPSSA